MRETSGDQCPISGWQPPVAAGGGSVISGVVGDGDLLQSSAIHESAYRLKIGVPLALWLQRVGGAVADGRCRVHPLLPSSVGAPRGGLFRLREADVVILPTPRRSLTIDGKAGFLGNAGPWVAVGGRSHPQPRSSRIPATSHVQARPPTRAVASSTIE